MTRKKYNGSTDPEPGPMANLPKVQASLRKAAQQAASRDTGVPVRMIGPGKHPVAGRKATTTKKGRSK